MEYDEFELQLGPVLGEHLHIRVLRSPAGAGESLVPLAPILQLAAAGPLRMGPGLVGGALFQALFSAEVGDLFHTSLRGIGDGSGMRLRLRINPRDSALAPLHAVPWELLFRKATEDFLALSRWTPVVRAFDIPRPAVLAPFAPPLRLLAVSGAQDPRDPNLDLAGELEELQATLRPNPDIEVEPLEDPEPRALRHALTRQPYHALHFMGHGVFDPHTGEGALLCRDPQGGRIALSGRHLATKLKDLGSLRLVVLNACDTALASAQPSHSPFAGVATALVLGGVPAVVAMQSPIDDPYALAFSAAFYDRLAHGLPVEEAVAEGRQAIHSLSPEGAEWAVPVLFLRTTTGDLFRTAPGAAEPAAEARSAEPVVQRRGWLAPVLGSGLVLSLGLAGLAWRMDRAGEAQIGPQQTEAQQTEVLQTEAQDLAKAEQTRSGPAPAVSVPPLPRQPRSGHPTAKPDRSSRTVSLGQGAEVLAFRVLADDRILDAFARALRQAAAPLLEVGLTGQTIRVEVHGPSTESSTEAGLPATICRLSATCYPSAGVISVPPVVRAQASEGQACDLAAEVLAQAVADRLAQFP
jgi:CHAT domain